MKWSRGRLVEIQKSNPCRHICIFNRNKGTREDKRMFAFSIKCKWRDWIEVSLWKNWETICILNQKLDSSFIVPQKAFWRFLFSFEKNNIFIRTHLIKLCYETSLCYCLFWFRLYFISTNYYFTFNLCYLLTISPTSIEL